MRTTRRLRRARWTSGLVVLWLAGSPLASAQAQAGFCPRMASQLGMVLKPASPKSGPAWKLQTVGGLSGFLFGGGKTIAVAVGTNNPVLSEVQRLVGACQPARDGAVCSFDGPAIFKVRFDATNVSITVAPGERAEVKVVDTKIWCRDVASVPALAPGKAASPPTSETPRR